MGSRGLGLSKKALMTMLGVGSGGQLLPLCSHLASCSCWNGTAGSWWLVSLSVALLLCWMTLLSVGCRGSFRQLQSPKSAGCIPAHSPC